MGLPYCDCSSRYGTKRRFRRGKNVRRLVFAPRVADRGCTGGCSVAHAPKNKEAIQGFP